MTMGSPAEARSATAAISELARCSGFAGLADGSIGASFASLLPLQTSASLAAILTTGSTLALLVFLPVALRRPKQEMGGVGGVAESTGE